MWLLMAVGSAFFAGLTSILAKCGIRKTDSDTATALRTVVVLVFSWIMAFAAGSAKSLKDIDAKSLIFLILSGLATGASWMCYYYAVKNGVLSVVVPIDKLSIAVTVLFSRIVLKEKIGKKAFGGLVLMIAGTLAMAVWG